MDPNDILSTIGGMLDLGTDDLDMDMSDLDDSDMPSFDDLPDLNDD